MAKIVVGVDGSDSAVNAAVWAATDAMQREETLRLVHAYAVPVRGYPGFVATFPELREGLRHQGRESLREARAAVENAAPGVEVDTDLVEGETVAVMVRESRDARVVVVGSRGLGGFTGMLVGSVAVGLAAHGHAPVVVVRGQRTDDPPPTAGPVVVGLDGSESSNAALDFAFDEAATRGSALVAVRTWNDPMFAGGLPDPAEIDKEERVALDQQLAGWRDRYPAVTLEPVVARGRPVRTLLEYAENARLVVVGSRGRGGFTGMLLGSTSQALVIHAPCPVAVVRPVATGPTGPAQPGS